jgi:magnesium transporter
MHKEMLDEAEKLASFRDWKELRSMLATMHPYDLAKLIASSEKGAMMFRALPEDMAADVFSHLEPDQQDHLLKKLTDKETEELLAEMSPDDRTALFEELPAKVTRKLFDLLSPEDLKEVRGLLGYPEKSVGRVMTPDYVSVRPEMTVAQTLQKIRKRGNDSETTHMLYVTDAKGKLVDELRLRKVLLASPRTRVRSLMDGNFVAVSALEPRERAYELIKQYDLTALPVVDSKGGLVGIVTVDDLIDIAEEEVTEDFHKIAGMEVGEQGLDSDIKNLSARFLYRKRVSWLTIFVFMNVFAGLIIASFEVLIAEKTALLFFLPLLIASGGNAGSQAAMLVIRAMATNQVKLKDWTRMFTKEIGVSLALGLTMGMAVSILGFVRAGYIIGIIAAVSMICIVVVGSLVGMSLPFIFTKFKKDPATASAPFITSIADICGVLIYFTIASQVLGV